MLTSSRVVANEATATKSGDLAGDVNSLKCVHCNVDFASKDLWCDHLLIHIKQPTVILTPLQLPPLKITIKNTANNNFEITRCSPGATHSTPDPENPNLAESEDGLEQELPEDLEEHLDSSLAEPEFEDVSRLALGDESLLGNGATGTGLPEDFQQQENPLEDEATLQSPTTGNSGDRSGGASEEEIGQDFGDVPGAEPTPPPDTEYPKIRIRSSGFLKESPTVNITDITDEIYELGQSPGQNSKTDTSWASSLLEDPLKIPGNDDILSLFNNNEKAKDFGFTTSDTDFMPIDRLLDNRNNQMQLYKPPGSQNNLMGGLSGLPMEALAQQVSRLQPPRGGNGMHQQNVLINIQQFPQPQYQPPHVMHPYPAVPPHQMYPHQPYPVYNSYYPPQAPAGYGQRPMAPPPMRQPPPMPQVSQPHQMPPVSQAPPRGAPPPQMPRGSQPQNPGPYRQPMQPMRHLSPRQQMNPQHRLPNSRPHMPPRQPTGLQPRQRSMQNMQPPRPMRPRMPPPQNGQLRQILKRTPEELQALQAKKRRMDVLTPEKDDDDCQVICWQPKNTDGGLPQIQSVQGGTPENSSDSCDSNIMHLSDSITLSVRNPQPRPQSPKKSDAKAVANILATRGITVTATPKSKDKEQENKSLSIPSALNLNGAVSIISAPKPTTSNTKSQAANIPTVDLTEDSQPQTHHPPQPKSSPPPLRQVSRTGLPFRCDLCTAQYPNAAGLSRHRQMYHKTTSGMCELGVPLINLKQTGIFQKLSSLGICNYIPLPTPGSDACFALPIISTKNPGNVQALGATNMLSLGPIRSIPRLQGNNGAPNVMNSRPPQPHHK